jgi:hypothetical protein
MRVDSAAMSFVANTAATVVQLVAIVSTVVETTVHFVVRRATEEDIVPIVGVEVTIAIFTIQDSSLGISATSSEVDSLVLVLRVVVKVA